MFQSIMEVATAILILCNCLILVLCNTCQPSKGEGKISFMVQTQRNASGHRIVKMVFDTYHTPSSLTPDNNDDGAVYITNEISSCNDTEVISTKATISVPPTKNRLPGYEVFPGLGYYKIHPAPVTWDDAYHSCAKDGSHLIILNSEAEANVVKQFLTRKYNFNGTTWGIQSWSGFHDKGVEGDFRTIHGLPLKETGYYKWHPNQPDNNPWGIEPDQDCGLITQQGLLNDAPCFSKQPYICEKPL